MPKDPWSNLPHIWTSIGLPGLARESTYQGYPLDVMPEMFIDLDDDLLWLTRHGEVYPDAGLHQLDEWANPLSPASVLQIAEAKRVNLPAAFSRFMTSSDLQSRVRSCTACYLDPGQRAVQTTGSLSGHLIHFLSDSQSIAHWYLHVLQTGESAVLHSSDLYCYEIENSDWIEHPACQMEQINVEELSFHFCSRSFSEFLFRFWIGNEIWFAVSRDKTRSTLTMLQRQYLEGIRKDAY